MLRFNGVLRRAGCGQPYFGINNRIGITSPELHAVVPAQVRMRDLVMNGLVRNVRNMNFHVRRVDTRLLPFARRVCDAFSDCLETHGNTAFGDLSTSMQKVALFLRVAIKDPEVLILDEAFLCMEDEALVVRCHRFIEEAMPHVTVLAVGHLDWETPFHTHVLGLLGDADRRYEIFQVHSA